MSPFDRPAAPPAHPSTTSPRRDRPASLQCAISVWNYRRAELIKFGWAQINQVALVISGPFLVISDAPLGEFKMGFLLNTPHTLAVPSSCSNRLEYRPFAFKIMMVACGHIPILSTRVMCVRLKEHPRKTADPSLFCRQRTASRRKRLAVSAFLRRRRWWSAGAASRPSRAHLAHQPTPRRPVQTPPCPVEFSCCM